MLGMDPDSRSLDNGLLPQMHTHFAFQAGNSAYCADLAGRRVPTPGLCLSGPTQVPTCRGHTGGSTDFSQEIFSGSGGASFLICGGEN